MNKSIKDKDNYHTSKTFRWIFKDYLLIFLLSFVFFCIFIGIYFISYSNSMYQDILNQINTNLSYINNDLSAYSGSFYNTSRQINYDNTLQESYTPIQPTSANKLQKTLYNYLVCQSYYTEIWYYYSGDDYLFSADNSNSIDFFTYDHYSIDGIGTQLFTDFLQESPQKTILHAQDKILNKDVVFFIYPVTKKYKQSSAYIIFVCSKKGFTESMEMLLSKYKGAAYLYGADGSLVTSISNISGRSENEIPIGKSPILTTTIYSDNVTSSENSKLNISVSENKKDWVQIESASNHNWKIILLIKKNYFTNNWLLIIPFILIFVVLSIGLASVYFSAKKSYTPIMSIKSKLQEFLPTDYQDELNDDYNYIQSCMDQIKRDTKSHLSSIREFLILSLINGNFKNVSDFNEVASHFGVSLLKDSFIVFIVISSNNNNGSNKIHHNLMEEVNSCLYTVIPGSSFLIQSITRNMVVKDINTVSLNGVICILSVNNMDKPSIDDLLVNFSLRMYDISNEHYIIGSGDWQSNTVDIPVSYLRAIIACNQFAISNRKPLYCYENLYEQHDDLPHFTSLLINYLQYESSQKVMEMLNEVIAEFTELSRNDNTQSMLLKSTYVIMVAFADNIHRFIKDYSYNDFMSSFLFIFTTDTESLLNKIKVLYKIVEEGKDKNIKNETSSTIEKMQNYIFKYSCNPTFSIKTMADHFSISVPTLSKYFKTRSKKTLIDTVTEQKIDKAMHLLKNTDVSIQDIGLTIGYYNTTSFIRRFKQVTNQTPGEYRKGQ